MPSHNSAFSKLLETRQIFGEIFGTRFREKGECPCKLYSPSFDLIFVAKLKTFFYLTFGSVTPYGSGFNSPFIYRKNTLLREKCQTWRRS